MDQREFNRVCGVMSMRAKWSFKPNGKGGGTSIMRLVAGNLKAGSQAKVAADHRLARETAAHRGWLKLTEMSQGVIPVTNHAIEKFQQTVPGAAHTPADQIRVMIKVLYMAASPYTMSKSVVEHKQEKYGQDQSNIYYRKYRDFEITHNDQVIISIHLSDRWQKEIDQAIRQAKDEVAK